MTISLHWTLCAAELLFLLVRSGDLTKLSKSRAQRTAAEQQEVKRGLGRALLLEFIIFVPASCVLLTTIAPLFISRIPLVEDHSVSVSALLGMASYGFPFAAVKRIIVRIALNTLKEFAALRPKEIAEVAAAENDLTR